jgi:hypothetical protein
MDVQVEQAYRTNCSESDGNETAKRQGQFLNIMALVALNKQTGKRG